MFSRWRERLQHALGFRLALWYAVVFVASSLALIALTYVLLAVSLRQYDREIVQRTLIQYASAYARGGLDALAREIQRTQATGGQEPLFVRTLGTGQDVIFVSMPEAWRRFDLSQLATPAAERRADVGRARHGRRRTAGGGVGAAAGRHLVPGRQEHRAPHATCSRASGVCCWCCSRRSPSSAWPAARC